MMQRYNIWSKCSRAKKKCSGELDAKFTAIEKKKKKKKKKKIVLKN